MSGAEHKRGVLVLTASFPPTPRVLKLSKHLPSFGWTPHVVVPAPRRLGDPRFGAAQLPSDLEIHATACVPTPSQILSRRASRRATGPAPAPGGAPRAARPARAGMGLLRSALLWLNTPDELIGWLPFAWWRGRTLTRRRDIRAIIASGPPFSTVLAGALLHAWTGLPLIADFRDAWTLDPADPFGTIGGTFRAPYGRRRVAALQALEHFCLARSHRVLFTSQYTHDRYIEAYPFLAGRSAIVWNGVEESDFRAPARDLGAFTFAYVGSLHDYQWPQVELFLRAFRIASSRWPEMASSRLLFAGHRGDDLQRRLAGLLEGEGLSPRTTLLGVLQHDDAVAVMKGAGALLLFVGSNRFIRLFKLSDCAAAGRRILTLAADDSETARHTRRLGHDVYAGDSADELAERLRGAVASGLTTTNDEFRFPFPHELHWRRATQQVAELLDEADEQGAKMAER